MYQTYFGSESHATSSLKVDGVEKCDSKATQDFLEIDGLLQRAFKFDCLDGYKLIGRINAYWTEMDVIFTTPDVDDKNIDLTKSSEDDSVKCDLGKWSLVLVADQSANLSLTLDDDCEEITWSTGGGCVEVGG